MPIKFPDYVAAKNHYCVCYLGHCDEYLLLLLALRPHIEQKCPELNVWICGHDRIEKWLAKHPHTLTYSQLKKRKREFACIRQIQTELKSGNHPIEQIYDECELNVTFKPAGDETRKCVICKEAVTPTKPLSQQDVDRLQQIYRSEGYSVEVEGDIHNAGLVVGVESPKLFEAGLLGIKTTLIDTGVGSTLYKKLFPQGEILRLKHT